MFTSWHCRGKNPLIHHLTWIALVGNWLKAYCCLVSQMACILALIWWAACQLVKLLLRIIQLLQAAVLIWRAYAPHCKQFCAFFSAGWKCDLWVGCDFNNGKQSCCSLYFLSASSLTPFPSLCQAIFVMYWTPKPNWGKGKREVLQSLVCRCNTYTLFRKYGLYVGQQSLQIFIIYGCFYKYRTSHSRFTQYYDSCKLNCFYPCYSLEVASTSQ